MLILSCDLLVDIIHICVNDKDLLCDSFVYKHINHDIMTFHYIVYRVDCDHMWELFMIYINDGSQFRNDYSASNGLSQLCNFNLSFICLKC